MPLPEWLIRNPPPPPDSRPRRKSWLTGATGRLLRIVMRGEPRCPLVRIDPRASLIGFVILVLCATLLARPASLLVCWALSLGLALAIGARLRALAAASVAAAILTALALLPASLGVGIATQPVADSQEGSRALVTVVMRTLACLALGIGLFSSARPEDLFAALGWFRVPRVFVAVLLLTYRHLHVIARAALEAHLARRSRVAQESGLAGARRWLGERIAALYSRSRRLGEELHLAMIARGFDGEHLPGPAIALRPTDFWWAGACIVLAAILLALDHGALT